MGLGVLEGGACGSVEKEKMKYEEFKDLNLPAKQEKLMYHAIKYGYVRIVDLTKFFSDPKYAADIAQRLVQLGLLRPEMNSFSCLVDLPESANRRREVFG